MAHFPNLQDHPYFGERTAINVALAFDPQYQAELMANNPNLFPSFLDGPSNSNSSGGVPRLAPSPMAQQQQQVNSNGNGNGMNGMPMMAGQQMDVNMLYHKMVELSEALKENREKTQGIVKSAEDLAVSTLGFWNSIRSILLGGGSVQPRPWSGKSMADISHS